MLQHLHISNYAIIEKIDISFSAQLNIITGETGAGKSILMGALSLVLGARADSNVLLNKEKKCIVEATFKIDAVTAVKNFLAAGEWDNEAELLVRREIAVNGKSRAFINDTPVNLSQLKELSALLVDLHQQFDMHELGDNDFQRTILDAIAGNTLLQQDYSKLFSSYKKSLRELEQLKEAQQAANATLDYNQFLYDELLEAALGENEIEQLEAESKLLGHAEEVKQQLAGIYFDLKESDPPLVQQLKSSAARLMSLKEFHPDLEELSRRVESARLELDDVAGTLDAINEGIRNDPGRFQLVNDKISLGYRLLKKHQAQTTNELLAIQEGLQQKLSVVLNTGEAIAAKEKETIELLADCNKMAAVLSVNRKKSIPSFTEKINGLLKQVGMPNAQVQLRITPAVINEYGTDDISFLFDANKTGHFESIHKVASGGELSRLMLCIKSIVAKKLQLPTLIFDEVDTGISGEAARQVGILMKELSAAHQVMAITHQPQIAARATAHYFVYKNSVNNKISTSVRLLEKKERINVIAQMIGGEQPGETALQNAREMVEEAV